MYHLIPDYDNYVISSDGNIIDLRNEEPVPIMGYGTMAYVRLNGHNVNLNDLVVATFIGKLPIHYRCKDPEKHDVTNFEYVISEIRHDNDEYYLDEILFKPIPNYDGYIISEDGVVYSLKRQKFIPHTYNHAGYQTVTITSSDHIRTPKKVHRLVYEAYVGKIDPGMQIDHRDNIRYHNHYTNLQQLTGRDNVRKSFTEGFGQKNSRWSVDEIEHICKMLNTGKSTKEIAAAIGYDYDADRKTLNHLIFRLRNGVAYTDITSKYDFSSYNSAINKADMKLSELDIVDIMNELSKGVKIIDLAKKYQCSTSTISKIRDGKTWKNITSKL